MRPAAIALAAFVVGGFWVGNSVVQAQGAPPAISSAEADYRFEAGTGLLVFHVYRERLGDFEDVMGRIGQGLQTAPAPLRREQGAGWRFFKARDSAETAVYVLMFDPAVREADYDPVKMLTELVPGDAQVLYDRLRASVMRVERLDLDLIR